LIGIAAARATSGDSIMSNDVRFFAGIDWATETHRVCLIEAEGGKIIGERAFAHGGEGLAELCDWLASTSGAEPPMIAVALEAPHGPQLGDPVFPPKSILSCAVDSLAAFVPPGYRSSGDLQTPVHGHL
jgi:Transposase